LSISFDQVNWLERVQAAFKQSARFSLLYWSQGYQPDCSNQAEIAPARAQANPVQRPGPEMHQQSNVTNLALPTPASWSPVRHLAQDPAIGEPSLPVRLGIVRLKIRFTCKDSVKDEVPRIRLVLLYEIHKSCQVTSD
jgi:hypothetical protein